MLICLHRMCLYQDQNLKFSISEFCHVLNTVRVVHWILYLGAFLAPVIRAFPSLPPDTSVLTTELGNRTTLGEKYRIYITRELSATVHEIGPVVAESKWNSIREAFIDFQHRFADYDEHHEHRMVPISSGAYPGHLQMESGLVSVYFSARPFQDRPVYLLGREVVLILKTVHDLFFKYRDKPRALRLDIERDHHDTGFMILKFRTDRCPWPERIPWSINVGFIMEVYAYGIDFDQSASSATRFFNALVEIGDEIGSETDGSAKPPRKSLYTHDILELSIYPPPNAAAISITAQQIVGILNQIDTLWFRRRYGPREFCASIMDQEEGGGRTRAKICFQFIDHDDRTALA